MQVSPEQVRKARRVTYKMWSGEVAATVFQQRGVYGHWSAAIVVEYIDDPIDVFNYDGYRGSPYKPQPGREEMLAWVADKLTKLSTGTKLNEGKVGDVEGLVSKK